MKLASEMNCAVVLDSDRRICHNAKLLSNASLMKRPQPILNAVIWIASMLLLSFSVRLWSEKPHFKETEVFVSGQDAINTYRIPSMINTREGTILVFCEGRLAKSADGTPTDLVLKRSLGNTGQSWEQNILWQPMQRILVSKAGEAYMNPVPIIDSSDGTILLLVNRYPQPYQDIPVHILLMKSSDEGATWSSPTDITAGTGLKELGPGIGIQMQNGRLVAPVYDGVIFSDDHGKTWKPGAKISGFYNETQAVELTDGSLMLNVRNPGHRGIVVSKNRGETWDKQWIDQTLTEPATSEGCQASLIRLSRKTDNSSKDRLLFSDPADLKDRFDMTVRISYDEGQTWPVAKLIKKGSGAYSSLTVFPDGTIGLVYETGNVYSDGAEHYSKISYAEFNLEWLTDGQDQIAPPRENGGQ